jgi:uncharacterized protein YbjT (DUF2867 family)
MILVTGATGLTGREVVKQLMAAGARMRILVRNPDRAVALDGPGVEIVKGDLAHPETLAPALNGVDRVFVLTAPDPAQVELQGNLVEAARGAGARRIVKISAIGADLQSPVRVGRWHAQTEKQIEASGLAFTHLRPGFFMQNMLAFAPAVAAHGVFQAPADEARVAMIHVRDVAAVAARVLLEEGHTGQTYTLTGPEALTYHDAAARLSAAAGRPIAYATAAPAEFRRRLLEAGAPEWYADMLLELYAIIRAGHASTVTDTVEKVTGRPPLRFDDFAHESAHAFAGQAFAGQH